MTEDLHPGNQSDEEKNHIRDIIINYLKEQELKITPQRKLIIEAVAGEVGWHVHPKSIYAYVKKRDDTIGIATVYRTLKLFEDLDILNKLYTSGKKNYAESFGHFHVTCMNCGKMFEINEELSDEIKSLFKRDYNFSTSSMYLSVYGLCGACKNKEDMNKR